MKKPPALTRTLLSLAISALGMPMAAHAALSFSTAPAGSATKEPAPNVIVSVDNSGSMGTDGIKALKDAHYILVGKVGRSNAYQFNPEHGWKGRDIEWNKVVDFEEIKARQKANGCLPFKPGPRP